MAALYNENDPYCAQWLKNLIAAGHIPPGDVDDRSIADVQPIDLIGYDQVHLFAGIGGWGLACRLARWRDDRPIWTASCPCQPFSVAGKGLGASDTRHLWPHVFRLARAFRPSVLMGEQVAAAVGKHWFDGVRLDLESIGYACRGVVVPACAVDAPHGRDRLWFVADAAAPGEGRRGLQRSSESESESAPGQRPPDQFAGPRRGDVAYANVFSSGEGWEQRSGEQRGLGGDTRSSTLVDDTSIGRRERRPEHVLRTRGDAAAGASGAGVLAHADGQGQSGLPLNGEMAWSGSEWVIGADGKARRVKPGVRLLAHGVPARVAKLRAGGNAIVPPLAAEIIAAYMDCAP